MPSEEEQEQFELDTELAEFADSLGDTRLDTSVASRDELMYRCGRAAANAGTDSAGVGGIVQDSTSSSTSRWKRSLAGIKSWTVAAAIMTAFGLGAAAGHFGRSGNKAHVSRPVPSSRSEKKTDAPAPDMRSEMDQGRIAVIRSGNYLYTSIASSQVDEMASRFGPDDSVNHNEEPPNKLRAGTADHWMDELDGATQ